MANTDERPVESESSDKKSKFEKFLFIDDNQKSEAEFCEWIDERIVEHPIAKTYHGKWKELIAWEEGDQFSEWDTIGSAMKPVNLVTRKTKVVINLMKPLVETIEAKLSFAHSVIGSPNSGEMEDMNGAKVATKIIAFNDEMNEMEATLSDLKYDVLRPGMGCLKCFWDETMTGHVAAKKDGAVDKKNVAREDGDIRVKHIPIFCLRPDSTAKKQEDLQYVIEIREVSKDALLKAYPEVDDYIGELKPADKDAQHKRDLYTKSNDIDDNAETFFIKEYWERPSKRYSGGRYIVTCEKKVIDARKNPAPDAELPYFWFWYKKDPYSFYGYGPLYYIQDIQRKFNRLRSIQMEHVEGWKPKMGVPPGTIRKLNSFTTDSLELLEIDQSNGSISPVQMPQLDPNTELLANVFSSAAGTTVSLHEVSNAQLPQYASRAPAQLYEKMLEQENLKFDTIAARSNREFKRMDRFRLKLAGKHYTIPRLVKIVGKNRAASVEYFDKADLAGNYDVQLEQGVSMHQSQSTMAKIMIELSQAGILGPEGSKKILGILNLGSAEYDIQGDLADQEKAIRENQAFLNGTDEKKREDGGVILFDHDDDDVHMDQHTNLAKSEEAAKWDEARFKRLVDHIEAHWRKKALISQGAAAPPTSGPRIPSAGDQPEAGGTAAPTGAPPGPPVGAVPTPNGGTPPPMTP
jgi:hypothetical protein